MKTNLIILLLAILFSSCSKQTEIKKITVAGVETPEISLNGTWKFTMSPPEKFWENSVDFQNWADILVPGECQMQGFAIKHDTPYVYKTALNIPKDYNEKQINLNFYGVYSYARVWINGNFIREHYGGFTKWSCDISNYVTAGGDAVLTVEITDRTDDISYGSGYAKHQIGGILRDVELTALPKQHFKQLFFETNLDKDYRNAELKAFYELSKNVPSSIKIELLDAENQKIKSFEKDINSPVGQLNISVENPKKWDAEHPHLYTVLATLYENENEILKTSKKIGFREVEVKGNQLLVNGNPVKLRGACRHDINPLLGRMTTPDYDKKDVLLAKEANMNFIRTSHYPPSETFLEYCDKYGIYVEDETAVCFVGSHRTEAYRATGASQSDPDYTHWYLSQLEEMVNNHRNHPGVIIWSIGNENTFGSNFIKSYNWVKQNDTTRPVIYSYPGQVPDSLELYDIISMHYPSWQGNLNQYGISTTGFESAEKPMLFDEWAHVACYNNFELRSDPNVRNFWGQSLDSMWTYTFDADGALGGAIWCMIDETFMLPENLPGFNKWWGILDKNVIPATYMGPTVGYGEWGIIDTWRRKKPEFWNTKKAYSPAKIYAKKINQFETGKALNVPVHNRFDHTNFSELKITWKYGKNEGEIQNFDLPPHQKGELVIPKNEWNNNEKLQLHFYKNDTFLVDKYHLQLGEKITPLPKIEKGNLKVSESEKQITITGNNFQVNVNSKTGLLENIMVDGESLIQSGPYINLKIPGERIQYSTIKMKDYAENWNCSSFNYDVNDGIAAIKTSGSYDSIYAHFNMLIDETGLIKIEYEINDAPKNKLIEEAGIKFITGEMFKTLTWNRNPYFTVYPENHLSGTSGSVELNNIPKMSYREKPEHQWEMDSKNYYYFGLDKNLPYTNIVRALKENIYSYSLKTEKNSQIKIISDGKQACRFDKIDNENTLIINDEWDYTSLLWGNYMKQVKMKPRFSGEILMKIN